MKRIAFLLAVALLGALPGVADAQGRGRGKPDWASKNYPDQEREEARERTRDRDRGPDSLGAGWREQQDEARRGVRQGRMMPLESVAPRIARRTPGRLLDAGIESRGGQTVYRVRWQATDGRRIDYIVDAASGSVISARGE